MEGAGTVWMSQPDDRPSIEDVLRCLEMAPNSPDPPFPEVDEEIEEESDDCDSINDFLDVSTGTGDAVTIERNTPTSPGLKNLTDYPLSPVSVVSGSSILETVGEADADADGVGPEATDLDFLISQVDPNDGGAYQVSPIFRRPYESCNGSVGVSQHDARVDFITLLVVWAS